MKKLIFAMTVAATMAVSAELKIGTVDLMLLVRNHPNYESNKTLLTATNKDYQDKLDAIKSEGDNLQDEGRKLAEQMRNPMLAAKAKSEVEAKLMNLQKRLMEIDQRYRSESMRCRQDLQDLEGRLLKTTTDDLRKRINTYAETNGYDFIIDSSAAPYSKASYSVTDEILKAMGVDIKNVKGKNESK